jgi:hypothetical protein
VDRAVLAFPKSEADFTIREDEVVRLNPELARGVAAMASSNTCPSLNACNGSTSAGLSNLTESSAVLQALVEFDELGRDVFLARYGNGPARS